MDNTIDHTFESANRVYDKNQLCPTIPTCGGGNIQPKVIDSKYIVAMRGRNPERPTDRTAGLPTVQRLEKAPEGIVNTLTTVQKDNLVLEENKIERVGQISNDGSQYGTVISENGLSSTLTAGTHGYANNCVLISQATKEGSIKCKVGGCYDASYPGSTTPRGRVQNGGDVTPTITAQGGENINYIEEIINEEEKGIREVLFFLRSEIGEKSFSEWTIRGLYCFLKKEILQQKLYAEIVLENWKESAELEQFTYNSKGNKSIITSEEELRDMWKDWETRCTPYRRELSEQQNRKLDDFMQKLSHKDTQAEEIVFYLWETCKGIGILRKTLSKIQEIWESFNDKQRSRTYYRIRKLTPREVWRLMGYTDEDFEKAAAVNSNTQLYKEAGNAIVKQVLMAIFSQML